MQDGEVALIKVGLVLVLPPDLTLTFDVAPISLLHGKRQSKAHLDPAQTGHQADPGQCCGAPAPEQGQHHR